MKVFFIGEAIVVASIIFLMGFFVQETSKKGLFFGVSIPGGYAEKKELKELKRQYRRNFTVSFAAVGAAYLLLLNLYGNPGIMVGGIFIFVAVLNINYYYTHIRVKRLKVKENWQKHTKNVVIVDTRFRENKDKRILVSPLWFIVPFVLIVFNIIIALAVYNTLPNRLPTHWGPGGEVDGWSDKSYLAVLQLPGVELLVTGLMYGVYKIIGISRQQIDPQNVEVSRERNRIFRYIWSAYTVGMSTIMMIVFTITQLGMLILINITLPVFIFMMSLIFIIVAASIIISLSVGQGGSRLRISANNNESGVLSRDDDKYWILGDFYYNPDDPSLFVEKRMGIGWDLNYARPAGKAIMALILILILGVIGLSVYIGISFPG